MSKSKITPEMEREAAQKARDKANASRWSLEVAIFLFAVLIIVVVLLFQDIGIEIVAPVAIFGLSMAWLVGWRRGRELYRRYYEEEIIRMEIEKTTKEAVEGTIEETVQKALRERWQ